MDIYCPKCGEPVELDYLHDVASDHGKTYKEVLHDFQQRGCPAIDDTCNPVKNERAYYADALYDLLGDDIDGAASMFDDLGW